MNHFNLSSYMKQSCFIVTCLIVMMVLYPTIVWSQSKSSNVLMRLKCYDRITAAKADVNDMGLNWVKKLNVATDKQYLFDGIKPEQIDARAHVSTELVKEKGRVTLHIYFQMPTIPVKDLWLGDDDTRIVDNITGTHYLARGTYDKNLWNRHFAVNAPAGTIIDFPIYFPNLPETVNDITICGVPVFFKYAIPLLLHETYKPGSLESSEPGFRIPEPTGQKVAVEDLGPWGAAMDTDSCEVYTNFHIVKPTTNGRQAIWMTNEKTYIASTIQLPSSRYPLYISSKIYLIDEETKKLYRIKRVQGLPLDTPICAQGESGNCIALIAEFEPLESGLHSFITYCVPANEVRRTAYKSYLDVLEMMNNQREFDFFEHKTIK